MLTVVWPTTRPDIDANIWRVLDLAGLTNSVRQSRNFTKSGFVYLDGNLVPSLRSTVRLGVPFELSIRFPNGRVQSEEIMLVPRMSPRARKNTNPFQALYKG
jgi:hypothetical protein